MKTITLDYELYKAELIRAKSEGARLAPRLKEAVMDYIVSVEGTSTYSQRHSLKKRIIELIGQIENVEV